MAAPVPGGCGGIGGGSGGATPNSVCGNGVAEGPYEECDGSAFQQQTCAQVSSDYGSGGRLKCTRDCKLDLSECRRTVCGDGVIEGSEICDGTTFAPGTDLSCSSLGYLGGTIRCSGCQHDISDCTTEVCGNGQLDPTEACEGKEFQYGRDRCEDFDGSKYVGGTLSCNANCTPNTSACVPIVCGNGVIEGGEQCDGVNLGSAQTCADRLAGYAGGVLSCGADCQYDESRCEFPVCGDGRIEGFEQCDGTNLGISAGQDCSDFIFGLSVFGIQTPFQPGPLRCSAASCQVDLTQCRPYPGCYLWGGNCGILPTRPCAPTIHCVP